MNDPVKPAVDPDIESLFLLSGGKISRGLERVQMARGGRLLANRAAMLSVAVTWLPLLILAAIEGVAWGIDIRDPFLRQFLPYGQFLLVVPVLILGEAFVGKLVGMAGAELRRSAILAPEDTPMLDRLMIRAVERWRGRWVNAAILVLTIASGAYSLWRPPELVASGWQHVDGRLTMPGLWYFLISLPVLRFLAMRWLWRLLMWAWVLWRAAQLKLHPQPTHPDRAGGLAFLGRAQAAFGVLVFAFGVQFSCLIADAVCYHGADLMAFRLQLIAFIVIVVAIVLSPLLVFAPKLARAREESLLFLSGSAYRGAEELERRLLANQTGELPTDEISGLADLGALYENARGMRPVPLEWRHILTLVLAAAIPFLPLAFLVMPAQEVFRTLAKLVF